MTKPRMLLAAIPLASLLWAIPSSAPGSHAPPSPLSAQPTPPTPETPKQVCERCRRDWDRCEKACAGPSGDQIPSDACLQACTNAYYRCLPVDHGCD